jgi:hypothetical protein
VSERRLNVCVGDIVHVNVAGQPVIYLNTFEAAIDLLDSRSAIYSDRKQMEMWKL